MNKPSDKVLPRLVDRVHILNPQFITEQDYVRLEAQLVPSSTPHVMASTHTSMFLKTRVFLGTLDTWT